MRIKSPFRDYYDGVAYSDEPLYLRRTESYGKTLPGDYYEGAYFSRGTIFFCGQAHRFIRIENYPEKYTFYNASSMEDFVRELPCYKNWKKNVSNYVFRMHKNNVKKLYQEAVGATIDGVLIESLSQFFEYSWLHSLKEKKEDPNYKEKLRHFDYYVKTDKDKPDLSKIPVVLINKYAVVTNPQLFAYSFGKVENAPAAYQKIEGFLSNIAYPNKPIPAISDKDMRDAKGFDEWSFRKEKSKR